MQAGEKGKNMKEDEHYYKITDYNYEGFVLFKN